MKDTFFENMKKQMEPSRGVMLSLEERIATEKRTSKTVKILRWAPSAACLALCLLCVLNVFMPRSIQSLPLVGDAFAALNKQGEIYRMEGKTPTFLAGGADTKVESVENIPIDRDDVSGDCGYCEGLDVSFELCFNDKEGLFPQEVEFVNLSGAILEIEGNYLSPTDEIPRLCEIADGLYTGTAVFDSASVITSLEGKTTVMATLYYDGLMGSYLEMPVTREKELSISGNFSEKVEICIDISDLTINYYEEEIGDVTLEYTLHDPGRTDIVYSISEEVPWADCYNIYMKGQEPDFVTLSRFPDGEGRYLYRTVYEYGDSYVDKDGEEPVIDDSSIYVDNMVIYNEATGERWIFEEECEVAEE